MDEALEYFSCQAKTCPYCDSIEIKMDESSFRWFGAHPSAIFECKDCKKEWFTDNRMQIDWHLPEEWYDNYEYNKNKGEKVNE